MNDRTRPSELGMIWAQSLDGVIGASGSLPWHLPEDLAHFRRTTTGSPVIMGRSTWESLPERFRPLPGRTNIVLSRREHVDAPGARVVESLDEALAVVAQIPDVERAWVIGGAQVYAAAIAVADVLEVTYVDIQVEGDALAPVVGPEWTVQAGRPGEERGEPARVAVSTTGLRYSFVTYRRTSGAPDGGNVARARALASSRSTSVV